MSQLQKFTGAGAGNDQDQKANVSALKDAADAARSALDEADAELEAKKAALLAALKGPKRTAQPQKKGQGRARSFFDNPSTGFCSC